MTSDGPGGAIIAWQDYRGGTPLGHLRPESSTRPGRHLWADGGRAICTVDDGASRIPRIIGDDSGGAIITWQDNRTRNSDIYAQRVDRQGVRPSGLTTASAICTATVTQDYQTLASDGSGGAIITWQDYRSGANCRHLCREGQLVGHTPWPTDRRRRHLHRATDDQQYPSHSRRRLRRGHHRLAGSAAAAPTRTSTPRESTHRAGTVGWPADGVAICTASCEPAGSQRWPATAPAAPSSPGRTTATAARTLVDIYAQRVDSSGDALWTATAPPSAPQHGDQQNPDPRRRRLRRRHHHLAGLPQLLGQRLGHLCPEGRHHPAAAQLAGSQRRAHLDRHGHSAVPGPGRRRFRGRHHRLARLSQLRHEQLGSLCAEGEGVMGPCRRRQG